MVDTQLAGKQEPIKPVPSWRLAEEAEKRRKLEEQLKEQRKFNGAAITR
jgi:hypothetical protein